MKSGFKIRWTPEVEETFDSIIEYLEKEWTEKEVQKFVKKAFKVLSQIKNNPEQFAPSKTHDIRKVVITKHNSLFYFVNDEESNVELYSFWDNSQDPSKNMF